MNTNGSFMCLCPQENPCNLQPVDLFFILDSSSSVGDANFRVMLEFVTSIGSDYDIGQGPRQTRVIIDNIFVYFFDCFCHVRNLCTEELKSMHG